MFGHLGVRIDARRREGPAVEVALAEAFGGLREVDGGSLEDSGGFRVTHGVTRDAVEAPGVPNEFLTVGDFLSVAGRLGGGRRLGLGRGAQQATGQARAQPPRRSGNGSHRTEVGSWHRER